MLIDFSSLKPGEIALFTGIVSLIAASIAFAASLTVAFVNAWAARRNARFSERRQYQLKRLAPFLDFAANRVADSTRLSVFVTNKQWDEATNLLNGMDHTSWVQFSSALGIAMSDSELSLFAARFVAREQTFRERTRAVLADGAGNMEFQAFRHSRIEMAQAADLLHEIAERVVFGTHRWRRRYYKLRRWIREKRKGEDQSRNE